MCCDKKSQKEKKECQLFARGRNDRVLPALNHVKRVFPNNKSHSSLHLLHNVTASEISQQHDRILYQAN